MEVMVTAWAIRRANLQSDRRHQQSNTQLLQAKCPYCCPPDSVKALKRKLSHSTYSRKAEWFNFCGVHIASVSSTYMFELTDSI